MNKFKFLTISLAFLMLYACNDKPERTAEAATQVTGDVNQPTITQIPDPNAQVVNDEPVGPLTSIQFEQMEYNYGTINEGELVEHVFKFTNTGKEPLIISKASGSCGCTVPDWPKNPIPPGGQGEIAVKFDSKGKGTLDENVQTKRVTVVANTDPSSTYLQVKGIVKKKEM
jgi:hypothetical protein